MRADENSDDEFEIVFITICTVIMHALHRGKFTDGDEHSYGQPEIQYSFSRVHMLVVDSLASKSYQFNCFSFHLLNREAVHGFVV